MAIRGTTIRLDQGRDLDLEIEITDDDGSAVDVSGALAAVLQVFSSPADDATLLLSATLGSGITAASNTFTVHVAGSATVGVYGTTGWAHFEYTSAAGLKPERLEFPVVITPRRTTV